MLGGGEKMQIITYPDDGAVQQAVQNDEPLMALISFDGKYALMSHADEAAERHILLMKAGMKDTDTDRYFRIVFDRSGAVWTFICPPGYKDIPYKEKRIGMFYKDGFALISEFLHTVGYLVGINIPKRYVRHFNAML